MAATVIDAQKPRMTHRERFRRLMHWQTVDRVVHWEFGYLAETIQRWHSEGLPAYLTKGEGRFSVEDYFGVDPSAFIPVANGLEPPFEGDPTIISEKDGRVVKQFPDGTILEEQVSGTKTIPHYIKMPIRDREDWKRFKERLDPNHPVRTRYNYAELYHDFRILDIPVGISMGSFLGTPRNWIGFEQLALLFYDDPDLVEDIIETLTVLYETTLSRALREIEADFAAGWEDICFRNGPMVSPVMFRALVAPRVKRVCDLLRQHGVDVIWTDCDGNINQLVPIWLDCGLNCMFPVEVAAGTDPVALRRQYGRRILLRGGIAKHQIALGRKEIIAELKRIEPIVADGGYIPHGDHRIPDDVPYENYRYYIREKLAMLGWKDREIAEVEGLRS